MVALERATVKRDRPFRRGTAAELLRHSVREIALRLVTTPFLLEPGELADQSGPICDQVTELLHSPRDGEILC
jgi:hypothetical protein